MQTQKKTKAKKINRFYIVFHTPAMFLYTLPRKVVTVHKIKVDSTNTLQLNSRLTLTGTPGEGRRGQHFYVYSRN